MIFGRMGRNRNYGRRCEWCGSFISTPVFTEVLMFDLEHEKCEKEER